MNEINWISLFRLIIIRLEYLFLVTPSFSSFDVIFSFGLILFCIGPLLVLLLTEYGLMTSGRSDFNKGSGIL